MKILIIDLIWQIFFYKVIKNKMISAWKKIRYSVTNQKSDIEKKQVFINLSSILLF